MQTIVPVHNQDRNAEEFRSFQNQIVAFAIDPTNSVDDDAACILYETYKESKVVQKRQNIELNDHRGVVPIASLKMQQAV